MRVVVDGKTCESAEENLTEIRKQEERFMAATLPSLQRLGIGLDSETP